ncbi:hypothetical protein SEEH0134_15248 [Salmonella enterica subsp. enterica serovar Heidelberg str. N20134]|nr:hypothetical protein SEEH0134_15248 [Salmonella enterica subsp. enterica serovar Heidelberg str. N20134]
MEKDSVNKNRALISMIAPASRKDQPNHILAQTNKLIIMGNKNCPPETNALIRIFAVLGERGKASIKLG